MDALSSQANVAGYKAAVVAAAELGRFFPMFMTAAGTVAPAKVLVLGAGVAGLQAVATARRLGAVVTAFDVREAVREQVESLGASFLALELEAEGEGEGGYARALDADGERRQQEALAEALTGFDVVITTALVAGGRAPLLVTRQACGA
jgi:NAD(P) transhydrogenase subunit alpha